MKRLKLLIYVLLTAILLSAMFAGCGSDNGGKSNETAAGTDGTGTVNQLSNEEEIREKMVLSWMIPTQQSIPLSETKVYKEVCEKLNVEFELTELPVDQHEEKKRMFLASRNIPDIMSWMKASEANTYGPGGAFAELSRYLEKDIPNLNKIIAAYPKDKYQAFTPENKLYFAPQYLHDPIPIFDFSYVKDEFDAVGVTQVDTWSQLYEGLKKLKDKYPDQYPLGFRYIGSIARPLELFLLSFTGGKSGPNGGMVGFDYDKKEFILSVEAAGYREAIEFFAKLYTEKIIHPEYMTMDQVMLANKINKGKIFMIADYVGGWTGAALLNEQTGFKLRPLPLPQAEGMSRVIGHEMPHIGNLGTALSGLLEQKDSKKFKRALEFLNYMYSEEMFNTYWHHPDVCDKVDGGYKYKDIVYDTKNENFITMRDTYFPWSLMFFQDKNDERPLPGSPYDQYVKNYLRARKDLYVPYPALPFTADQQKQINVLIGIVTDRWNAQIALFAEGKKKMTEWQNFVNEIKSSGGDQLIQIYNEVYKKYFNQ